MLLHTERSFDGLKPKDGIVEEEIVRLLYFFD